jgi:hypothetical protein
VKITDRQIAKAILFCFAESELTVFAPSAFYDDDSELAQDICDMLGLKFDNAIRRRMFRVCNRLCGAGVFYGKMVGTQKYYLGEPAKQRVFGWCNPGHAARIQNPPRKYNHIILGPKDGPEFEMNWLLNKAFPPQKD